jgi:hypothetical protein
MERPGDSWSKGGPNLRRANSIFRWDEAQSSMRVPGLLDVYIGVHAAGEDKKARVEPTYRDGRGRLR